MDEELFSKVKIFDVFMCYRKKDESVAAKFRTFFANNNISTFTFENMPAGVDFASTSLTAIRNSRVFIPLISADFSSSSWTMRELSTALEEAQSRDKVIVPIMFPGLQADNLPTDLRLILSKYQWYFLKGFADSDISECVKFLVENVIKKNTDKAIERINAYISGGLTFKATAELCELTSEYCSSLLEKCAAGISPELSEYLLLFTYLEKIEDIYDYSYGDKYKDLGHKKADLMARVNSLLKYIPEDCGDILKIAAAIRILYFHREIVWQSADAITSGDVSEGIVYACPIKDYILKQEPYVKAYKEGLLSCVASECSKEILQFVSETEKYIYSPDYVKVAHAKPGTAPTETTSDKDDILKKIASFIHEGNKLFDLIEEQSQAEDFIKYLTTSYERLKSYCALVGAKDIQAECIDRIVELNAKADSKTNGETSEKASEGIKALLGISSPRNGKYDVFISHKSEDYDIAEDMYGYLSSHLKSAFLDKKSLPEMSEAEYKRSIMSALDGSTHFVVILSNLEYLNSKWVGVEMSTFHTEMIEGRKEKANFIFVVTDNVFAEISRTNKTVLPIEYRSFEIMLVSEYKQKILSYLQ